ncbi:MAG: iron-sulfur cluster assembly scaffold protein [Pseudomonadota bacterium]
MASWIARDFCVLRPIGGALPDAYVKPMNDLYTNVILDAAASIPAARRLEAPDATATKSSRVCGSTLTLDITAEGGRITDFGLDAKACALGQAAASIVARGLIGAEFAPLMALRDEMRAMLKDGGPPPTDARFLDLRALESIRDYPQRHASTLLIFEAIADCVNALQAQTAADPATS